MKAALYIRVSTDEQAKEGFSIAAQLERLKSFCSSKGWRIYNVYIDEGYTGRDTNRPGYRSMMRDIKHWDVCVAIKLDRLHRNLRNFISFLDEIQRNKKHLALVHESVDTSSAMGRFFLNLMASIAQLESEQISERVRMGMEQAKCEGYHVGRPPKLFKTKRVDGHLKIEPTDIVWKIHNMRKQGMSLREISEATNIPVSTIHRTLQKLEVLLQDGRD